MASPETYISKIRGLLAKAEATEFPEEADACVAMAQLLMTKHAITDLMLGRSDREVADEIGQITIRYTGIFRVTAARLGSVCASANNCRPVFANATWCTPHEHQVEVTGWRSDLERVEMLETSLRIQQATAISRWEREEHEYLTGLSRFQRFKERREFIASFAAGVKARLAKAYSDAKAEVVQERATETGETVQETTRGMELVLRSRREQVNDWYDKHYGKTLRNVRHRAQPGSKGATYAGYTAGYTADTGAARVHGGRRAISHRDYDNR